VFFRSDEKLERLDGTNILTHPNIVAIAMMPPEMKAGSEGDDFNTFEIPFEYKTDHVVDFTNNRYKLAVIFSSSFNGDLYEGAIGSRLVVDDVLVVVEDDTQRTLDNNQEQ
ncbi:MAG: PCMD domain-containing protein, partial [Tannerellaceae bacterium]|nr:PCMD domain-containing protein [Tannerellaceae bacterium]